MKSADRTYWPVTIRVISVLTVKISKGGGEQKVFLDFGERFGGCVKVGDLEEKVIG